MWWTMILKIIDFIETGVFIFRKKFRQVSFLHLYHHTCVVYVGYLGLRYYPGAPTAFPVALNSAVHVVMYSYYLLSTKGPKMQKILNPFKPYITIMQMVSFSLLILLTYIYLVKF